MQTTHSDAYRRTDVFVLDYHEYKNWQIKICLRAMQNVNKTRL
jgi:hypothetical protein